MVLNPSFSYERYTVLPSLLFDKTTNSNYSYNFEQVEKAFSKKKCFI